MSNGDTHTIANHNLFSAIIRVMEGEVREVIGDVMQGAGIKEPGGRRGGESGGEMSTGRRVCGGRVGLVLGNFS